MELCEGGAVSDIFAVCNEGLSEEQIAVVTKETLRVNENIIYHNNNRRISFLLLLLFFLPPIVLISLQY